MSPAKRRFRLPLACASIVLSSAVARAEPVRILVAAAHSEGTTAEAPLRHARDDAHRVVDVLTSVGGVRPEHAIVVEEPTPEVLRWAFDRARAIAGAHRPEEVTLFFYFSGHGDHDAIHLGARSVPLSDVAAQIGTIPAALKVAVVDACRSVRARAKGVSTEPGFAISLTGTPSVTGAPAATGAVWLHASADGEVAQESDDLGGAVFTHYWVDGLRGAADANGDGKVTLAESYDFAYGQTLYRSARGTGALQRPAASIAIHEALPVVITATGATSALKLPRSADAQYVVFALGSHTVAAEAWGSPDRAVTLAVPPGRYVIQRRAPGQSGALDVSLARGQERELSSSDFRAFPAERLAQKGGEMVVHPNEIEVGYALRTSRLFDLGQALRWRYSYRFGAWVLSLSAEGGLGSQTTVDEVGRIAWVGGGARLEYRAPVGPVEVRIGAGPAADIVAQRFDRADASRVALGGYPTRQSFHALAWGGDAAVGLRVPLAARFALGIDVEGQVLLATATRGLTPYGGIGGVTSAAWSF